VSTISLGGWGFGEPQLLEAGKIVPVIDRTYPLSEVPEAIRYFAEGRHRGKIVITMDV
jgi:NADPH:quinone reductase-like Zn-dependent oxidoreductase